MVMTLAMSSYQELSRIIFGFHTLELAFIKIKEIIIYNVYFIAGALDPPYRCPSNKKSAIGAGCEGYNPHNKIDLKTKLRLKKGFQAMFRGLSWL